MNISRIQGIAVAALLVVPYFVTAQSVQQDLRRTLKLKQTMSVDDLTEDFMAIKIDDGSQIGMMGPFMFLDMMYDEGSFADQMEKIRYFDARWTKGDVVEIGGSGFLVTYKTDTIEIMAAQSGEFEDVTSLVLRLELVSLDNIRTIRPLADLTPEKYAELFGGLPWVPDGIDVFPGRQKPALSNVKQLAVAMIIYQADYDDVSPYVQSTKSAEYLLAPYMMNDDLWKTLNPNGSRFYLNMAYGGVSSVDVPDPAGTVLFYESRAWPDGRRIVAFADTHAAMLTEEEWQ